jgi:hypothetical protein
MRYGPRFPRPWFIVIKNGTGTQVLTEGTYTEYHNTFDFSTHIEVENMIFRDAG